jgi:LPXTG-motif cell wall-anchored protein
MKKRLKPISVFLSFLFAFQIILSNASTVVYALTNQLISFAYQDFNALAMNNMLNLQSNAVITGGKIRLTENTGYLKGSAFYKQKVSVANDKSFSSFFTFQIKSSGSRADGIVFVLDTNTNSIGLTGAAIGYGGIQNSIGIEFDTYKNTGTDTLTNTTNMNDPDNNHIGINVNGSPVSVASKSLEPLGIDLADGATKFAWVDYNGANNQLEVRISKTNSRPELPTLAYTINLSQTLGSNEVYSGFTAATGGSYEEHDIVSWYFDSKYNPIDTTKNSYISAPTTVSVSANPSTAVTNNSTVNINVKNADGSNAANIPVKLTTDYGILNTNDVTTDINGNATAIFYNNSYNPGNAVIKAVAQGGAYNYCTINYVGIPRVGSFTKSGNGETLMNFKPFDFLITYNGIDSSLTNVIIKSLPANGALTYDGTPVAVSQEIPISYIDKLTFMPNKYWHGNTSFNWAARSSQGSISNTGIGTLSISAVNHAPEKPEGLTTSITNQHHKAGDIITPRWGAAFDPDNDKLTYVLEYGADDNWTTIYSGNALEYSYTLPSGYSSPHSAFRVKAVDPGKLESGYTYSDSFAQDSEKPVIRLIGMQSRTIQVGLTYTEEGATAFDNFDGDLNDKLVKTGSVDTSKIGDYAITYTVSDAAGNTSTVVRDIHVIDITKPIISLKGDSDETLEVNHDYIEKGATATDNYNGDVSKDIAISGNVDTHKLGDYVISYDVKDSSNNSADTVTRTIHVVDTTKPVITINGDSEVTLEVHNDYVDAGAVASDNYDSEIASKLSVTGTVDKDKLGDYTIYYNVKDGSNNTADTVKRIVHVVDTTKPVLSINGKEDITLEVHNNYLDEGVTAEDNYDSDIASKVIKSGEVNIDKLGDYVISYDVKDSSNNVATTVKRNIHVVDTMKPTISLVGKSDITLEVHSLYVDLGAVASDNYDNELSSAIDVNGNLNTDKLGDYTIAYNVKDSSGNKADTILRTIHVVDTTKPVIKLKGEESQTIEVHKNYEEAGFSANDNYDNDLTSKVLVSGAVNTDKLGEYTLSYDVKDSSNNSAITLKRTVHVVDTTKPVITLKGEADINIEVHKSYTDEGVSATDNYDNDITPNVTTSGKVNADKIGQYVVSYDVKDSSGNVADTVKRTIHVVDTTKPIISLKGETDKTIEVHNSYVDPGATATDNYDEDITSNITKSGEVNTDKVGDYSISYDVKDNSNNAADTAKRVIHVVDTTNPIIALKGDSDEIIEVNHDYVEKGATATDNYNGDISKDIVISGSVDTHKLGDYVITYNVKDAANNSASTVRRTVHVVDSTKPVITLKGDTEQTIEVHSKYVDPGVTLIDNYDNDINSKLVISGAVNTDKLGDYTIVYNVKDGSGNTADTVARTIHVKDTTKPVINIVGDSVVTVEAQNTYTDRGATATDNYDNNLTESIKAKGAVDTNKVGEYTISYDVSDLSGNKADTVKRTVKVVDIKKPIIEMKGDSDITLEVGTVYEEQGATAKDNYDGDITGRIVMDSNVNTNVKGNYFVKYNVIDASGNAAKEVVRNIHIIDKIESISLSGQVVKQEDNSLIAGADISLYDLEGKLIYKTTSDSKGIYLLPNVKLGQYILEAHDSNNNVTSVQIDAKPNSVLDPTMKKDIALVNYNIEMDSNPNTIVGDGVSTTKLSVVVKDKNGNTLKGLKVDFDASKGSFPNGNSAVTDNNGTAYVDYKSDKIESTTSEVIPVNATITDAKNGLSTSRQILVTFEPGSIQGIVVDNETGKPVSGAVIVVSKDFNNDGIVDFYSKMVTDESGKYKIAVPKGNIGYDVNITKPVKIGDTVQLKTFKQNCVAGDINGDKKETYASNNTVAGLLLTKDTNGKTSVLTSYNGLSMAVFDSSKTDVKKGQDISNVKPEMLANIDSSENGGAFQAEGLSVGKEYVLAVYYTFPSGQKLIVGTASVNVAESGQINITNVLIDPYGTITDSATGKVIDGVHVVLYYANTARNIAQGIKPDTIVNLPEVKGFKPADNANPQESNADGEYAFMVFPNTDYYVKADKAGYDTFKSPTISVNNEIVRFDVTMNKTTKPVVPTTPDKSEVVKATPNTVVTNKAGTDKTITPVNTPDKAVKQTNLPKTGSLVDSNLLFVIGAIVIVIGGVVLARRKRK